MLNSSAKPVYAPASAHPLLEGATAALKTLPAMAPRRVISFPVMHRLPTAREAKEFLVSGIVAEAQRENVSLSAVERKMLYFSETGWTLPDIMEVNDAFDREYDPNKYEEQIAQLIRKAAGRARTENPERFAAWVSAARKLKQEDHYLSVMIDRAGLCTRSASDHFKGAALVVMGVCVLLASRPVLQRIGLWTPPLSGRYGSYTIDEGLNNFVGYVWLCTAVLVVCGLMFSHFDRKRRMYNLFEHLMATAFRLFGRGKNVRSE